MLGVSSRFAVLKIEGEEPPPNPNKKKAEKPKVDSKKPNNSSTKAAGPAKSKKPSAQNGQVCRLLTFVEKFLL